MESTHSTKVSVAKTLRAKRLIEAQEGRLPIKKSSNITFKEFAQEYLKLKKHLRSYKTKERYVRYFVEEFGNVPLRKFKAIEIEKYGSKRLAAGRKKAPFTRN